MMLQVLWRKTPYWIIRYIKRIKLSFDSVAIMNTNNVWHFDLAF